MTIRERVGLAPRGSYLSGMQKGVLFLSGQAVDLEPVALVEDFWGKSLPTVTRRTTAERVVVTRSEMSLHYRHAALTSAQHERLKIRRRKER